MVSPGGGGGVFKDQLFMDRPTMLIGSFPHKESYFIGKCGMIRTYWLHLIHRSHSVWLVVWINKKLCGPSQNYFYRNNNIKIELKMLRSIIKLTQKLN